MNEKIEELNNEILNLIEMYNNGQIDRREIVQRAEELASITTNKTETINKVLDIMQKEGIDRNHNVVIDNYFETFIDIYNDIESFYDGDTPVQFSESNRDELEFVINYVKEVTSNQDFNILNEQWISDILQLRLTKLPAEYNIELYYALNLDKEIPDKVYERVTDYIENNQDVIIQNEAEFDSFLQDLGSVKLHAKTDYDIKDKDNEKIMSAIIGERAANFIIKQTLLPNSVISNNPEKYQSIVERALEDMGKAMLSSRVKLKWNYTYLTRDIVNQKEDDYGVQTDGIGIAIKRDGVREFIKNKDIYILGTVLHENDHANQAYDIQYGKNNNYIRYMMYKEKILWDKSEEYYPENYAKIFREIAARQNAAQLLSKYLKSLNIEFSDEVVYNGARGEEIYSQLQKQVDEEELFWGNGVQKNGSDFFVLCDKAILEDKGLLKKYPDLSIEYNEDGSKKSFREMLLMLNSIKNGTEANLFIKMLTAGKTINKDNIGEVIKALNDFDCKGNEDAKAVVVKLTKDGLNRVLGELKQDIESADITQTSARVEQIEEIINNVNSRLVKLGLEYKSKNNENDKSVIDMFRDFKDDVTIREIRRLMPNEMSKYDDELVDDFRRSVEYGKKAIEVETRAVKRLDLKLGEEARYLEEKAFKNLQSHHWGESYFDELQKYRTEAFEGIKKEKEQYETMRKARNIENSTAKQNRVRIPVNLGVPRNVILQGNREKGVAASYVPRNGISQDNRENGVTASYEPKEERKREEEDKKEQEGTKLKEMHNLCRQAMELANHMEIPENRTKREQVLKSMKECYESMPNKKMYAYIEILQENEGLPTETILANIESRGRWPKRMLMTEIKEKLNEQVEKRVAYLEGLITTLQYHSDIPENAKSVIDMQREIELLEDKLMIKLHGLSNVYEYNQQMYLDDYTNEWTPQQLKIKEQWEKLQRGEEVPELFGKHHRERYLREKEQDNIEKRGEMTSSTELWNRRFEQWYEEPERKAQSDGEKQKSIIMKSNIFREMKSEMQLKEIKQEQNREEK